MVEVKFTLSDEEQGHIDALKNNPVLKTRPDEYSQAIEWLVHGYLVLRQKVRVFDVAKE